MAAFLASIIRSALVLLLFTAFWAGACGFVGLVIGALAGVIHDNHALPYVFAKWSAIAGAAVAFLLGVAAWLDEGELA